MLLLIGSGIWSRETLGRTASRRPFLTIEPQEGRKDFGERCCPRKVQAIAAEVTDGKSIYKESCTIYEQVGLTLLC
jgi:hypothetical protein